MTRFIVLLAIVAMTTGFYVRPEVLGEDNYRWKLLPGPTTLDGNGVPLQSPTASIGIHDIVTDELYGCTDLVQDAIYDAGFPVIVDTFLPDDGTGKRYVLIGKAWGDPTCTGTVSGSSAEPGAVWHDAPATPILLGGGNL
jgi:hypothetical protein